MNTLRFARIYIYILYMCYLHKPLKVGLPPPVTHPRRTSVLEVAGKCIYIVERREDCVLGMFSH